MNLLSRFRKVAVMEGWSYILLLFVAMPLKYLADWPYAVKYIGWAHGLLFVIYLWLLIACWSEYKWSFGKAVWAGIASLLPFGTFVLDRQLARESA